MKLDIMKFLRESTAKCGPSGLETGVSPYIAEAFAAVADDVRTDNLGSVVARVGAAGPRCAVVAHQDEIAMLVSHIEDDGSLRMRSVGGVDPRVLPAAEVTIHAKSGDLYGVVGSTPPHLTTGEERQKPGEMDALFVDTGYDAETAKQLVRVGDIVTMIAPTRELADGRVTGKTLDDRAGVATLLECGERLARLQNPSETYLVASSQEEVGGFGACVAGYHLAPDYAIAVDVTHAEGAGADKFEAVPIDKVALTLGPVTHPALNKIAKEVAEKNGIDICFEVSGGMTWTDADDLQIARSGVPCLLVSIPLRYMHTSVETISLSVVREAGRFLALFIEEVAREWGNIEWY